METEMHINIVPNSGDYKKWDFSLIKELDTVLNWFAEWENRGMEREYMDAYISLCNTSYKDYKGYVKDISGIIRVCLDKLVRDGYVHENKEAITISMDSGEKTIHVRYSITFEGLLFLEEIGSYAAKFFQDDALKRQTEGELQRVQRVDSLLVENARRLNHLTLFLGIVTFAAAAPLVMDFYEKHFLEKIPFLYFLSGLLLGMLVWWLLTKLLTTTNKTKAREND